MIKDIRGNETVVVDCGGQSGRLNISETTFAINKGLHFIGCGGNQVSKVGQLIVEDTIFHVVEGRGTALVLNEVYAATIVQCSFLSNKHDSTFQHHNIIGMLYSTLQDGLNYLYLERTHQLQLEEHCIQPPQIFQLSATNLCTIQPR